MTPTKPLKPAVPVTTRAGPASHAVSDAAGRGAPAPAAAGATNASNASQGGNGGSFGSVSGAPAGTNTTPSSDWLAELRVKPAPDPNPPGVPISTQSRDPAQRGRALESKRGQR